MSWKPSLVATALLVAGCAAGSAAPAVAPESSRPPVSTSPATEVAEPTATAGSSAQAATAPSTLAPGTLPPTTARTTPAPPTTSPSAASVVDLGLIADISMTWIPPDVVLPTSGWTLDEATNPINGRRSGRRLLADEKECVIAEPVSCLRPLLDSLGFDVTSGSEEDRQRRLARATTVVQLDAGLPATGSPDVSFLRYVGGAAGATLDAGAAEVRQIGTSAQGQPITALRYGDGPRTVLVVGQTHGDEEAGLRVLLRARSLPVPDGVTMWVVPTMNPDGLLLDTRFLANGADPNRRAPSQPEQRAVHDFALAIRPSLTVWYHQNYGWIGGSGASMAAAQRYQALTGLGTLKPSGNCAVGFMWCPIDHALGSSSILVELPDVLTPAEVHRHASALLAVAATHTF